MREARRPVTTAEIADKVLSARMLPATDPELRKLFIRRVGQCLLMLKRRDVVTPVELPGRFQGWELV
jgi:hypothetical protein